MKTISSPILFKQIIGRGSRIDPATEKYWFRIIDFTDATRLFDQWDRPPSPVFEPPKGPFTASLRGTVFSLNTKERIVGASVSIQIGPNTQRGPIKTDSEGGFVFDHLPAGILTLIVNASGYIQRKIRVETLEDHTIFIEVPLKPEIEGRKKIRVEGLEVSIADEAVFTIDATGKQLSLSEYRNYSREQVLLRAPSIQDLRNIWISPELRHPFLEELRRLGIHPEILAEVEGLSDADIYDILAHIAFGAPIRTRSERATAFLNREQSFLKRYSDKARKVILELIDKYRVGGIEQIEPEIFSVSPFREWGGVVKISQWFGGLEHLGHTLKEMRERIYPILEVEL